MRSSPASDSAQHGVRLRFSLCSFAPPPSHMHTHSRSKSKTKNQNDHQMPPLLFPFPAQPSFILLKITPSSMWFSQLGIWKSSSVTTFFFNWINHLVLYIHLPRISLILLLLSRPIAISPKLQHLPPHCGYTFFTHLSVLWSALHTAARDSFYNDNLISSSPVWNQQSFPFIYNA